MKVPAAWRRPLGLVLAGGGAHGAWQAGVLERLLEAGLDFDEVFGFSVGALNGAGYAFGRMERLMGFWRGVSALRVLRLRPKLRPFALYSDAPLWDVVRHAGADAEAKASARCALTVASLDHDEARPVYARYTPGGEAGWDTPLQTYLVASCAIPWVFPPVRVRRDGRERTLVDGGIPGRAGLSFEETARCPDVVVLRMVRPDQLGRRPWNPLARMEQDSLEALHGLMRRGLDELLGRGPRVFDLFPSLPLEFPMLGFEDRYCGPALELGRRDAESLLAAPERFAASAPRTSAAQAQGNQEPQRP